MQIFKKIIVLSLLLILLLNGTAFSEKNIQSDYQAVVYSGQPSGVFAAVSAARNGLSTILILKRDNPGGLMTYGGLNYLDLNFDKKGNIINEGMFQEWYERIGEKQSFTYQKATNVFNNMLDEENVKVIKESKIVEVEVKDNLIKRIKIKNKEGEIFNISGNYFIDADQDAELSYLAGAEFFNFGSDINLNNRYMASTLVLNIDNIDLDKLKEDIQQNTFGPSFLKNGHAYGFKEIGNLYQSQNKNIKLRGLNIIFNKNNKDKYHGSINALLIFNYDPLSDSQKGKAYQIARKESRNVLKFLRENLKGFENASLNRPAEELYIRESRHLIAEEMLKTEDLLENKIRDNTVVLASYPLDYQASDPDYQGFVLFNPGVYGIPYGSFLPTNIDNLMVVSRSTGMSSLAAASGRVLPIRMNSGAVAGKAASLAYNKNISLKELNKDNNLIKEIQEYMELNLKKYRKYNPIIKKDSYYPYIKELVNLGLIIGGYNNDFKLDSKITEYEFSQLLIKGMKRRNSKLLYKWVPGGLESISTLNKLDKINAYRLLLAASSHRVSEINKDNYLDILTVENLVPSDFNNDINTNQGLTRKEAYYLVGYFLKQTKLPEKLLKYRGIENE
ncbi:MAG: FAD-dependent oxidoreductase [Halanaerobiales bacterium]|nr:FAD-dependent oxidoreductase [Halanaerobiales bacterium]